MAERLAFSDPGELAEFYGEPCNNCVLWENGSWCSKRHRQKTAKIERGHIPELTVRKIGGCADHVLKEGVWWHEEPVRPFTGDYGGSSTNILVR